jgi:hypothetical protein
MLKSVNSQGDSHSSLCSPLRGTFSFEQSRLDNLYAKLDNCGKEIWEIVKPSGEIFTKPVYCDNRCCENSDCQKHRLYKYMRKHEAQIDATNKSMRKPKAWIFTGWHLEFPIDRKFCQDKLRFLYRLLFDSKHGSVSEFSIHMELKFSEKNGYRTAYLHFHVVSGGIKDLRFVQHRWSRIVRFEKAISPKDLGYYVSKYASKTPFFPSGLHMEFYHLAVYKLQMHRFSSKAKSPVRASDYVVLDFVRLECKSAFMRDSYLNLKVGRKAKVRNQYHPFLEKPPPHRINLEDFGLCFESKGDNYV